MPASMETTPARVVTTSEKEPVMWFGVSSFTSFVPKMKRLCASSSYTNPPITGTGPVDIGTGPNDFRLEEPVVLKTTKVTRHRLASALAVVLSVGGMSIGPPLSGVSSDHTRALLVSQHRHSRGTVVKGAPWIWPRVSPEGQSRITKLASFTTASPRWKCVRPS